MTFPHSRTQTQSSVKLVVMFHIIPVLMNILVDAQITFVTLEVKGSETSLLRFRTVKIRGDQLISWL